MQPAQRLDIFVSMPMKDRTEDQIRTEIKSVTARLRELYPDYVVNVRHGYICKDDVKYLLSKGYSPLNLYISRSLDILSNCDKAYFAEGWSDAKGCVIEHLCCERFGIDIIDGDDDYDAYLESDIVLDDTDL